MSERGLFKNFNGDIVPPLGELLRQQAQRHGERLFAIIDDEQIRYGELYERSLGIARGMVALGLQRGDRIGILMPNCMDFMVSYFAAQLLGAIVVTINARYKSHELAHAVAYSDIKLLFTTDRIDEHVNFGDLLFETLPDLEACQSAQPLNLSLAPALKNIVLCGNSRREPFMPLTALVALGENPAGNKPGNLPINGSVDDIAVMLFTSGTSAAPKACQLTHRSIYQTWVRTYPEAVDLQAGEKMWVPMPCFHIGGIGLSAGAMAHGACFLSSIHHQSAAALRLIHAHKPEHLYPGFFTLLLPVLREPDYSKASFASVRSVVAVAPYETHLLMKELMPADIPVFQLFGMTEAAGYVSFTRSDMAEEQRLKTNGMPIEGCEVRIAREEDDLVLAVGEEGEIQFRGPNAFHSYYKDEAATRAAILPGGWVKTGDFGRLDRNGAVYYLGRIKDMLKVGGENVAAAEIEAYLGRHPAVKLAQVVGREDDYYGEVPVAFVELMDGQSAEKDALMDFCKGKLASFKIPREVIFVTEWPMSSTKIQKFRLRQLLSKQ